MFIGAMGERTVRTAGEIADGWIVSILEPAGYVRAAKQWLREGAEQAGRDPEEIEVVQYFPFSCSSDSASAKAAAKAMIAVFIEGEIELYRRQKSVMAALSGYLETVSPEEYLQVLERLNAGVDPVDAITDELADELSISGTPEECAAQLRRYRDAGVTEAALVPAGMDIEDAAAVVGRDIRPLLAS
jgi:alkanesulfonate monooxygenase SsuD/methylene tetrahydromethanopterin reductase-like flavin-dependent oxidoreductase (luciferase family)